MEPSDLISIVISIIALSASFLSLAISLVRHFDKIATANYDAIYWFIVGLIVLIPGISAFIFCILLLLAAISDLIGLTDTGVEIFTSFSYYVFCFGGIIAIGVGLYLVEEKGFKPYRDEN